MLGVLSLARKKALDVELRQMEPVEASSTPAMATENPATSRYVDAPVLGDSVLPDEDAAVVGMLLGAHESAPGLGDDPFEREFRLVVLIEGGYGNNPNDSGGKTRYGITEQRARASGYTGLMRELPLATAKAIYRKHYWDLQRCDEVHALAPSIAAELFEFGVNAGPGASGTALQRLLNVLNAGGTHWPDITVDGLVGDMTLQALRSFLRRRGAEAEAVLYTAMNGLQVGHYTTLAERRPKDEAFTWGWFLNRVARAVWAK